jgi:hypothetical protein
LAIRICRRSASLLYSPMHFVARMNQRVRPEAACPMTGSVKSGNELEA